MEMFLKSVVWIHIAFGFVGLVAYWVPIVTKKGRKAHRTFGKIFKYCAYVVLTAAFVSIVIKLLLAALDGGINWPNASFAVFLAYLAFVTLVIVHYGVAVLLNKTPEAIDGPLFRTLAWGTIAASIGLIIFALTVTPEGRRIVLLALSPVGAFTGIGILRYLNGKHPLKQQWLIEHLGSMIGAGIAFHTAFAVFGASRFIDFTGLGSLAVLPWILPTIIGLPASFIWANIYRKKFSRIKQPAGATSA